MLVSRGNRIITVGTTQVNISLQDIYLNPTEIPGSIMPKTITFYLVPDVANTENIVFDYTLNTEAPLPVLSFGDNTTNGIGFAIGTNFGKTTQVSMSLKQISEGDLRMQFLSTASAQTLILSWEA